MKCFTSRIALCRRTRFGNSCRCFKKWVKYWLRGEWWWWCNKRRGFRNVWRNQKFSILSVSIIMGTSGQNINYIITTQDTHLKHFRLSKSTQLFIEYAYSKVSNRAYRPVLIIFFIKKLVARPNKTRRRVCAPIQKYTSSLPNTPTAIFIKVGLCFYRFLKMTINTCT